MADTITVTGVVGTTPHLGDAAGTPVCNFRLATSLRRYDKQTGAWTEYGTNWYSVGAYRYLGKNVAASVRKGDRVVVTGRVRLREWSNQAGKGMTIDIDATSVGHDLTWGTTTFRKHNDTGDAVEAEAGPVDVEAHADQTGAAAEERAGLIETAGESFHNGWPAVSVGTEDVDAA
ncbi:single-stranded DNA-binding protein [Paramicrobacterium fandaimingii]|uniref:single-stranded DNA-binding protein n=1 Tax=Paramicrobacterium fandaimingii TaxID=2708079 RepID=UPI00141DC644|nr:single-stranded DNA-binding protein [Microbacterium fandaimingii]